MTIMAINNGNAKVKATAGDTHLGGQDFDNRIVDHCIREFQRTNGIDITGDGKALLKLKLEVEKAKRVLSAAMTVEIHIDSLKEGEDFDITLTRATFEILCAPEMNKIVPLIE